MLDKIKKALFNLYGSDEKKGIFMSGYTQDHSLLVSQGVVSTDAELHTIIDSIYEEIEPDIKDIRFVACDIISEIIEVNDSKEILNKDPQEFGFVLIDEHGESGVMLPSVSGVADAKHALYHIKKKYGLSGNVKVFIFRTERIIISK